jgi:hypothetical protein
MAGNAKDVAFNTDFLITRNILDKPGSRERLHDVVAHSVSVMVVQASSSCSGSLATSKAGRLYTCNAYIVSV